jgi:hypothetical protein
LTPLKNCPNATQAQALTRLPTPEHFWHWPLDLRCGREHFLEALKLVPQLLTKLKATMREEIFKLPANLSSLIPSF